MTWSYPRLKTVIGHPCFQQIVQMFSHLCSRSFCCSVNPTSTTSKLSGLPGRGRRGHLSRCRFVWGSSPLSHSACVSWLTESRLCSAQPQSGKRLRHVLVRHGSLAFGGTLQFHETLCEVLITWLITIMQLCLYIQWHNSMKEAIHALQIIECWSI